MTGGSTPAKLRGGLGAAGVHASSRYDLRKRTNFVKMPTLHAVDPAIYCTLASLDTTARFSRNHHVNNSSNTNIDASHDFNHNTNKHSNDVQLTLPETLPLQCPIAKLS